MKALHAVACLVLGVSVAVAAELNTLKGKKLTGDLVAVTDQVIVLKTATGDVSTPLPEAMQLQLAAPPEVKLPDKYTDVELIDGTLFHCKSFLLKGKTIEFVALPDKKITLPLAKVAYILTDAQDPKMQKEWGEIFADRGKRDRFFLLKDGRLDGLEGTFGDADADGKSIPFDLATGGSRKLPIDKLVALLFNNRLEGNIASMVCRVVDSHQNVIVAHKAAVKDGKLTIETVAGASIEYATLQPVVMLDYSKDKVVFVSEMKFKEENLTGDTSVRCTRDINLDNQPIQVDGVIYQKGLVVHAGMLLTFDLGGDYKEFKAVIGYDLTANSVSDVKVSFVADGRPLYSADIHRGEKPSPITLDVKKVRQLMVTVTPTEGLFIGRQVALADAKVTK